MRKYKVTKVKTFFVYISFLFFPTSQIVCSEKPFVSQSSERSVELLLNMPCEMFCNVFMQLELLESQPLEALKTIEEFKLVSKKFRDSINNKQSRDLQNQIYAQLVSVYGLIMTDLNFKYPRIISYNKPTVDNLRIFLNNSFRDYYSKRFNYKFNDINQTDSGGNTILHEVIDCSGKIENKLDEVKKIISLLIKKGINLEAKNYLKYSALMSAIRSHGVWKVIIGNQKAAQSYLDLAEFLLQNKAQPVLKGIDHQYFTPEAKALIKKYGGNPEDI